MPWGWECRDKHQKQVAIKSTERRGAVSCEIEVPGPADYQLPDIFCGKGFSRIKRAPAYTFGSNTPVEIRKPSANPNAPLFNIQGYTRKGTYHIPGSIVTPHIEPSYDHLKVPGPGAYKLTKIAYRRPPAYTMRLAAKPPYQPWDQWTPPPNMYCPPIPSKRAPQYSLGNIEKQIPPPPFPGPGVYDVKFSYIRKNTPKFSFGAPFRPIPKSASPSPNAYCEKLLMSNKRSIPAPTFGIKHTPYAGQQAEYLRTNKLQSISE